LAIRASHTLTAGSGRAMTAAQAARLIPATPGTGSAPGTAARTWATTTGPCWRWPATTRRTGTVTGTAWCWSAGTATPEPCRSTGAGHPGRRGSPARQAGCRTGLRSRGSGLASWSARKRPGQRGSSTVW